MNVQFTEDKIIKTSLELLSSLTSSLRESEDEETKNIKRFDDALNLKISSVKNSETYASLMQLHESKFVSSLSKSTTSSRWQFVSTCLQLMKIIRDTMLKTKDEKVKLLSIAQKKILSSSFEFVISLGLLPNMLPGVGVSLELKCKNVKKIPKENINDFAKYRRLCFVTDTLLCLNDVDIFHDLLVSKYLEDLLASLFQLSYAPLKKPINSNNSASDVVVDLDAFDCDFEITEMTYCIWRRLEENRLKYEKCLDNFEKRTYKPIIIQKFLILLGTKDVPRWIKLNVTKRLTNLILENNGIVATMKAVITDDIQSPVVWSHCTTVAKLISATFCNQCEDYASKLSAQLLEILKSEKRIEYHFMVIQVAALTVNLSLSSCPQVTEKYLLNKILAPLKEIKSYDEQINVSLCQLYNLCVIPSNNTIALPISTILPVSRILYVIYCGIKDSVCYLKSAVKELLAKLFTEANENMLEELFDCFILDEKHEQILSTKNRYTVSSCGGVSLIPEENDFSLLEEAAVFLDFIKNITSNDHLICSLFTFLLKKFVSKINETEFGEKRLVIVVLLSELSQNEDTVKYILKNGENIIQFVGELLKVNVDNDEQNEVVCICLTFLTMVLHEIRKKKDVNWNVFTALLKSVEKYRRSSSVDVKLLADEVHTLISTRGLIGNVHTGDENCTKKSLIEEIPEKSECEKNIEAACDPLLPVRAHALTELISLIKKGDAETIAKKEEILCLFEENLKDKESFLYLRAIEGISCLGTLKPDSVLPLLCQEFSSCSISTTQLKVGEILMRTVKLLNDFMFVYKSLLINTFLNGVRSKDSLIRASSLSNLAEICLLLKNHINDVLYEVLLCAQNVALYDESVEPRRAAVLLMRSLFCGLSTSMFKVLESRISELYRVLKRIYSADKDDVVRLQAQLSIEALNENTKEFLTFHPQLEKKIHILHPNNFE